MKLALDKRNIPPHLQKFFKPRHVLKPKDLIPTPWLVGLALQRDGWYLRSDCLWIKGNPMPSSVTDRPTPNHEYVLLLSKKPRYFFDMEAVKERSASDHPSGNGFKRPQQIVRGGRGNDEQWQPTPSRNLRTAWNINCKPYKGSHYATFPPELPLIAIRAGTSEYGVCSNCLASWVRVVERGEPPEVADSEIDRYKTGKAGVHRKIGGQYQKWLDANPPRTVGWRPTCSCNADIMPATVLDPFMGSGTTAYAARKLGRRSIGFDLDGRNIELVEKRMGMQEVLL